MRTCPRLRAVAVPADQVRGHRESLEIVDYQGLLTIGSGQLREGFPPGPSHERFAAGIERVRHLHDPS
jgi:hypothetical protein